MKQRIIITLDKPNTKIDMHNKTYEDVKDLVEIVFEKVCSVDEAKLKFEKIVLNQAKEYHKIDNKKPWRIVRMFDEYGNQILQES